MSLSIYQATVPAVLHTLGALAKILDKAEAFCEARKIEPAVLVNYRLAPDMFPLSRQIQITTDQAKGMVARLTGSEIPGFPDTETSFADLKARIAKTIDYVQSFGPEAFDGAEDRAITLKAGPTELNFTGRDYAFKWVFPNFYFHATTTYDILRHCGVEVGKRDFLGM
ncbi:MAG: DUF1993 domain-containing protein [Aliidongia sp.]